MIKGILFDLGYTLEKPETGDWMLTQKFYHFYPKEIIQSIPKDEWNDALRFASTRLASNHKIDTLEEEHKQFTQFYYDLISSISSLQITNTIAEEISYDRTYDYQKYVLFDTTIETLKKLKDLNYKLGVLSDTWPSTKAQLRYSKIDHYFDSFTYSFQFGVFKPDSILYQDARNKLDLEPNEIVFVDDLPKNLYASEQLGMYSVQSLQNPHSEQDTHFDSITKPIELLDLLTQYKTDSNKL